MVKDSSGLKHFNTVMTTMSEQSLPQAQKMKKKNQICQQVKETRVSYSLKRISHHHSIFQMQTSHPVEYCRLSTHHFLQKGGGKKPESLMLSPQKRGNVTTNQVDNSRSSHQLNSITRICHTHSHASGNCNELDTITPHAHTSAASIPS